MTHALGVDIGGTKIAVGIVDTTDPTTVINRHIVPTPDHDVINQVRYAIAHIITPEVTSIGIGAPGVIDETTGVVVSSGPTMQGWAGTRIAETITEEFSLPVAVHNDVRVMGLGESIYGAGRDYNNVLFVSLGTGVGGAIVRDGQLVASPHHTAGELRALIGRLPDGRADLLENFAAGPGLARRFGELYPEHAGRDLRFIMKLYHAGDATAHEYITSTLEAAGETIAGFTSAIDVDAIVIGGGVGNIGTAIIEPFARGFAAHAIPPLGEIPIRQAQLGTDAPIVGAAYLGHSAIA